MKRLMLMIALVGVSCDKPAGDPTPSAGAGVVKPLQAPGSQPAPVVPRPKDPAQLDRMILAGFTPHADHLHAPGVNECPLAKGTEAIM